MKRIMKATISVLLTLLLTAGCAGFPTSADAAGHSDPNALYRTTVMIYMCGSNLESRLGAATKDLYEMIQSGFDENCTDVVVMAGGSKAWKNGLDAEKTTIMEMRKRGMRTVWQSEEPMNMSEPATLQTFLEYCDEHYSADRRALILWDHGGGPNEGACYDELFPGQSLTLPKIKRALSNWSMGSSRRTLNWIGFDACLMANLETAYILQDYADYLIASQAEEPSSGWNYAFLKGLEHDRDTKETAERIIDGFFEQGRDSKVPLTLSCIDLHGLQPLLNSVNSFFEAKTTALSPETFPEYSNERYEMLDFGQSGEKGAGSFDLVDLCSLAEAYGQNPAELEALKAAVDQAVICSRSTLDGASGLSVYHPYYDREAFENQWASSYAQAFEDMSGSYVRYIQYFSRIMTGEALTSWAGVETVREEDPDGTIRLSATLSEEQAEQFVHADLRILQQSNTQNMGLNNTVIQIWDEADIQIDENRTLTAVFPNKAMYVVDDATGEIMAGPIDFIRTEENQIIVHVLFWDENGILDDDLLRTEYICRYLPESDTVEVDSIRAMDEMTGEYSARMTLDEAFFRENDYSSAVFWHLDIIPTYRGEELLGLGDWENDSSAYYTPVSLPRNWHFEIRTMEAPPELSCATFQITDTQNVRHCSSMIRIFPDLIREYEVEGRITNSEAGLSVADVSVENFLSENDIFLQVRFEDLPADYDHMEARNIVLNDTVQVPQRSDFSMNDTIRLTLTDKMTTGLSELRTIAFDLVVSNGNYREDRTEKVRVEFAEPLILEEAPPAPLAECRTEDDLVWRIWGIQQRSSGVLQIRCDVQNVGTEQRKLWIDRAMIEHYDAGVSASFEIEPGQTVSETLEVDQRKSDTNGIFNVISTIYEPLALRGIDSIQELRLIYQDETTYPYTENETAFHLTEALSYAPILPERPVQEEELLQGEGFEIQLAKITPYHDKNEDRDKISLALWLQNDSDEVVNFYFDRFSVNGTRVLYDDEWAMPSLDLLDSSFTIGFLHVTVPEGTETVREISFDVFIQDVFVQTVTVKISS